MPPHVDTPTNPLPHTDLITTRPAAFILGVNILGVKHPLIRLNHPRRNFPQSAEICPQTSWRPHPAHAVLRLL